MSHEDMVSAADIVQRLDAILALLVRHTSQDDAVLSLLSAGLDAPTVARLVGTSANAVRIKKSRSKSRVGRRKKSGRG